MSRIKVKKILALLNVALMLQFLSLPSAIAAVTFAPDTAGSELGSISGDAVLKTLGPLQMSEGKVVIQENSITVLSNSSDSPQDAELKGAIIKTHPVHDAKGETLEGIAIFTQGFSVAALDNVQIQDSVKASEGLEYVGRIVDVTPKILRIQTAEGIKIIPTRYIVDVKSTRAFTFSLPLANSTALLPGTLPLPPVVYADAPSALPQSTPTIAAAAPIQLHENSSGPQATSTSPPTALSLAPPAPTAPVLIAQTAQSAPPEASSSMVTFTPTYVPDPNAPAPAPKTPSYQAQLTQRHPGKKATRLATYAAFAAACVLVPLAFCTIAKPPPAGGN
jgi:hypothetical protein